LGSLAVASSTPGSQLLSPAKLLKLNHARKAWFATARLAVRSRWSPLNAQRLRSGNVAPALSAAQVRAVPPESDVRTLSLFPRHRRHRRHCIIPIEAKPTATKRLAHYHRHCVIGVIGVVGLVIGVIASYRSNLTNSRKTTCAPSSSLRHRRHRLEMIGYTRFREA